MLTGHRPGRSPADQAMRQVDLLKKHIFWVVERVITGTWDANMRPFRLIKPSEALKDMAAFTELMVIYDKLHADIDGCWRALWKTDEVLERRKKTSAGFQIEYKDIDSRLNLKTTPSRNQPPASHGYRYPSTYIDNVLGYHSPDEDEPITAVIPSLGKEPQQAREVEQDHPPNRIMDESRGGVLGHDCSDDDESVIVSDPSFKKEPQQACESEPLRSQRRALDVSGHDTSTARRHKRSQCVLPQLDSALRLALTELNAHLPTLQSSTPDELERTRTIELTTRRMELAEREVELAALRVEVAAQKIRMAVREDEEGAARLAQAVMTHEDVEAWEAGAEWMRLDGARVEAQQ